MDTSACKTCSVLAAARRRPSFSGVAGAPAAAAPVSGTDEESELEKRRQESLHFRLTGLETGTLIPFVLMLGLLVVVIRMSRVSPYDHVFADNLRASILETEFDAVDSPVKMTFYDITTLTDVWNFLQGPLLASLYVETSYAGAPLPPERMRHVSEQSLLVGPIRLYQVRARDNEECEVPEAFSDPASASYIHSCYSKKSYDTDPIIGSSTALPGCANASSGGGGGGECNPRVYASRFAYDLGEVYL